MKFLIDAQLPKKLSSFLNEHGLESIHTLDLPNKNFTSDSEIIELSIREKYIVVTKDVDFWDIYKQKAEPYKLIYLTVGNFSTQELLQLFANNINAILEALKTSYVLEINRKNIISLI
jgi:predicted nuclease of predicted toxin-antitoxin system